ncbi:MAG TPA: phosphotransferase [Blastocatellia bacterium]|nr:phosphotransferase [Blastocatellia bacterium]
MSYCDEGNTNDVVIVNREIVFRFLKEEGSVESLKGELKILGLLENHISLRIPRPLYQEHDLVVYHLIPGKPLRRDILLRLGQGEQQLIADQLATFHRELHGVGVDNGLRSGLPNSDAFHTQDDWLRVYGRIQERVFPYLPPHAREWARSLFDSLLDCPGHFEYEPALIYGSLSEFHIVFDEERNRVNGIIDFGTAGLGDPAIDIAVLIYLYGETFCARLGKAYPEARSYLKRARHYAETFELLWALNGIETGDPRWFLSHIGTARGIRSFTPEEAWA